MSWKNPEYDFKWCPGCGDFGVRRALEWAMVQYCERQGVPLEHTVVVAGIGCSGNLVHLLEGPQPYGFHGIHGRTLPLALGIKMANPALNVLCVAGDGDFLGIGLEHIAPQALRNLDVACLVLDNGVYGLTKGQSSPTTPLGQVTSSTPYGKIEDKLNPLEFLLSLGVSFVASMLSSRVRELADLIYQAMAHPGFAVINVQSPCTTYYNTYELLKGNPAKGIEPLAWDIPADHDPSDREAALRLVRRGGVPMGLLYRSTERPPLHLRMRELQERVKPATPEEVLESFRIA